MKLELNDEQATALLEKLKGLKPTDAQRGLLDELKMLLDRRPCPVCITSISRSADSCRCCKTELQSVAMGDQWHWTITGLGRARLARHREAAKAEGLVDTRAGSLLSVKVPELEERLRVQENRLHAIEEALGGERSWEPQESECDLALCVARLLGILRRIKEALPWDDDNEADSWYFHESKPKPDRS